MKIYSQDNGWAGCIIVIETSMENAIERMKGYYNFDPKCLIEEHPIEVGFEYCCLGDS
jgi:hypothetical protein